MRAMIVLVAVATAAVALAGCGDSGEPAATTTAVETVETTPPPSTTEATTTPTTPKPTVVSIRVVGGVPKGGIARPAVKKGTRVVLVVRSDVGEEVHVHGYDIERRLTPGTPLRIRITATVPGRFEVELHDPDVLLAVLSVRP